MSGETRGDEYRTSGDEIGAARRMEALGRLAAGIAHDFNNVLAAIRGYGQIALRSLDAMAAPGDEGDGVDEATVGVERAALVQLRADVAAIDDSAKRAATLTRQLSTLTLPGDAGVSPLDLATFAAGLYGLARRVVPAAVELTLAQPATPLTALANEPSLLQASLELLLDLRDALGEGGRIRISTLDAGDSRVALVLEPSAMPADVPHPRTRLVVGELLAGSGGELRIDRAPACPALVLALPAAPAEQAPAGAGRPAADAEGITVLLVEDDAAVRRIAGTVLERLGYRVLPAGDGPEALRMVELLAADDVTPDLLVTDVTMPAMSGPQLAEELRRRAPEIGVLYMSGMGEPASSGKRPQEWREDFLQKPFTLDELAARVSGLLARA